MPRRFPTDGLTDSADPGTPTDGQLWIRSDLNQLKVRLNAVTRTVMTDPVLGAVVTLTDASTVAVDVSLGNYFRLLTTSAVGATRALGAPTNATDGQKIIVEVIQDATGSRALTYATGTGAYAFSTDVPSPTLSTGANKRDYLGFVYNGSASRWHLLAVTKGF